MRSQLVLGVLDVRAVERVRALAQQNVRLLRLVVLRGWDLRPLPEVRVDLGRGRRSLSFRLGLVLLSLRLLHHCVLDAIAMTSTLARCHARPVGHVMSIARAIAGS